MKKILLVFISVILGLFLIGSASAMTLAWDTFIDPVATDLRIYSTTDPTDPATWSILVDSIPTNMVASELDDHTTDGERVYYKMRSYDSNNQEESGDSNVVSFYWTESGAGHTGPAAVGGIKLLDCDYYDGISDDDSNNWDICNERYNK